jgi:hypothetical protein
MKGSDGYIRRRVCANDQRTSIVAGGWRSLAQVTVIWMAWAVVVAGASADADVFFLRDWNRKSVKEAL